MRVTDGEVQVSCSPVGVVHFKAQPYAKGGAVRAKPDETITSASYRLDGTERSIRVEVIDLNGKGAWSNPLFLDTTHPTMP